MSAIRVTVGTGVSTALTLLVTGALAASYYIDESTNYEGHGCSTNDNLNAVTRELKDLLDGAGWTGSRWVNEDAWPQDFVESCSASYGPGGLDEDYADNVTLSVFRGHGSAGFLGFGYPHDSWCGVTMRVHMRLGSMDGRHAAVAVYLSCRTMKVSKLPNGPNYNWLRQQFGFNNDIGLAANEPADFVWLTFDRQLCIYGSCTPLPALTNAQAWLDVMDGYDRQPVAVSYGSTSDECWEVHDGAKLDENVYRTRRPGGPSCEQEQPHFHYCWEQRG